MHLDDRNLQELRSIRPGGKAPLSAESPQLFDPLIYTYA